jgi:hypothetical protein
MFCPSDFIHLTQVGVFTLTRASSGRIISIFPLKLVVPRYEETLPKREITRRQFGMQKTRVVYRFGTSGFLRVCWSELG